MQKQEEIAQSKTGKIKSISIIWLIPVIAILVGAWMLYFQISHRGDLVVISFENSDGIEAGKTQVKVKNVQVGIVEKVELNDTLDGVMVSVRIHNNDKSLLVEDSNFWVVRPKIGAGGITGLSTLISGAYIELSPGSSDVDRYDFSGLENAPVTPSGSPGLHITLASSGEHALTVGDNILFRGIRVGRIEYVHFNTKERMVYYNAFVESPYDKLITSNTKFWEVNGLEVNISADGIRVQSGTLETLISGGVMFGVPDGIPHGDVVTEREVFTIFPNKGAIDDSQYEKGIQYVLLFKDSIRGLRAGAPVEFRGVKVGRVVRTDIVYPQMVRLLDKESHIPVMITINPTLIGYQDGAIALAQARKDIVKLLEKGLHGSIETGSYLTGSKYIVLQYVDGLTTTVSHFGDYVVIPTLTDKFDHVIGSFAQLLDKINHLPLDRVFNSTDLTMQQATVTLKQVAAASVQLELLLKQSSDEDLVTNINAVLINIKKLSEDFSDGSATNQEMRDTLRSMQDAMNELKPLLIKLNQNPDSLIFSHPQQDDIEPRKRQ